MKRNALIVALALLSFNVNTASAQDDAGKGDVVGSKTTDAAATKFLLSLSRKSVEQGTYIFCDGAHGPVIRGEANRVDIPVGPEVCAVAHSHVRERGLTDMEKFKNRKNRMPSPGDALAVEAGYPNYVLGTDGIIRVLERRFGVITVRVVDVETTPEATE